MDTSSADAQLWLEMLLTCYDRWLMYACQSSAHKQAQCTHQRHAKVQSVSSVVHDDDQAAVRAAGSSYCSESSTG
eukprot:5565-Heterococcus_DN1.PRE.2